MCALGDNNIHLLPLIEAIHRVEAWTSEEIQPGFES